MLSPAPLKGIEDPRALAQAIVDTIREPLLVLDEDLRVMVASRAFYRTFHVAAQETQGQLIYELGNGEWNIPALRALLARVAPEDGVIEAYEIEHSFPVIGQRVMRLNARKVFYESHNTSTILVAIEDITEWRAAERERDDLLRQKQMLLEEMQHRVANSLQIIASILLMKARAVDSPEMRTHLEDAHKRVMAVAAVQKHLEVATGPGAIQLEPYLTRLCASLAGAMIREGDDAIDLKVQVAGGDASSAEAVSIGLIVTELVINALKHAFPVQKPGNVIVVAYTPTDAGWALTISDNGVGKDGATTPARVKGGLGTSIVGALAEQLAAQVSTISSPAGASVSITHVRKPAAPIAQRTRTVLVVEDEPLVRLAIATHLRDGGWDVVEAGTGDEAQSLFLAGAAIDIVFSDVQMPGDMDGIGLAHWMHAHHPAVHMLLTSGKAAMMGLPADVCAQASMFKKPYEHDAVTARMHALMA